MLGARSSGSTSELAPWFSTVTSTETDPLHAAFDAAYPVTESCGNENPNGE